MQRQGSISGYRVLVSGVTDQRAQPESGLGLSVMGLSHLVRERGVVVVVVVAKFNLMVTVCQALSKHFRYFNSLNH